jgi:predicted transposase YbfD/YdcC
VPKLLDLLSLNGTIVTVDAMNCQRDIARRIIDKGGDYVFALKANQQTLYDDVRRFLDDPDTTAVAHYTTVEGDHGRIETRTALVSTDIVWLQDIHHWAGLKALGKVIRTRQANGKTTTETAHYLASCPLSAERFGSVTRAHWSIENSLHWVLDVVMNKDDARNRKDNGPENLAILRHIALNIIRKEQSKGSTRLKSKRAAWNNDSLPTLLAQS